MSASSTPVPFNVEEMRRKAQEKLRELQSLQENEKRQAFNLPMIGPMLDNTRAATLPSPQILPLKPQLRLENPTIGEKSNPYFDPRVKTDSFQRPKNRQSLHLNEKGKFEQDALRSRQEAQILELQKRIQATSRKVGFDSVASDLQSAAFLHEAVPDIEWWDMLLLKEGLPYPDQNETSIRDFVKFDALTIYIHHPLSIPPPIDPTESIAPRPIKLTKEEAKKLRRQRRLAEEKEKQEKIRMGIIPAPPPKMKLSTLHRIQQSDSIQGPTSIDAEVRRQVAERLEKHQKDNEARSLTFDQKRDKKRRKLALREGEAARVAVFRINKPIQGHIRFKVEANAQQWYLSGCALICDDMSLVIVEGSEKALNRYKKLMLRRIKWGEEHLKDADENVESSSDEDFNGEIESNSFQCVLVWEGEVKRVAFRQFRVKQLDAESQALELLSKFGIQHYWVIAKDYVVPE